MKQYATLSDADVVRMIGQGPQGASGQQQGQTFDVSSSAWPSPAPATEIISAQLRGLLTSIPPNAGRHLMGRLGVSGSPFRQSKDNMSYEAQRLVVGCHYVHVGRQEAGDA